LTLELNIPCRFIDKVETCGLFHTPINNKPILTHVGFDHVMPTTSHNFNEK